MLVSIEMEPEQLVPTKIILKHNFVPSGLFCYLSSRFSSCTTQYTDEAGFVLLTGIW